MLILTVYFAILLVSAVLLQAMMLPKFQKVGWSFRFQVCVGYFLFLYGLSGFLGSVLLATQILRLPDDFEWPIVSADAYVTTPDGIHLAAHPPTGRIQLYDANWQFIRGWNIDAEGGTFLLLTPLRDQVEIITERPKRQGWHYTCDLHGKVLAKAVLAPKRFSDFAEARTTHDIPTYPWLWPLAHPFGTWALFVVGLSFIAICKALVPSKRHKQPAY